MILESGTDINKCNTRSSQGIFQVVQPEVLICDGSKSRKFIF